MSTTSPVGPKSAEGTRQRIGTIAMALAGASLLFVIIGSVMRFAQLSGDAVVGLSLFSCVVTLGFGIVALLNRQMRAGVIAVITPVVLFAWLFFLMRIT